MIMQSIRKIASDGPIYVEQTIQGLRIGCRYAITVRAVSRPPFGNPAWAFFNPGWLSVLWYQTPVSQGERAPVADDTPVIDGKLLDKQMAASPAFVDHGPHTVTATKTSHARIRSFVWTDACP